MNKRYKTVTCKYCGREVLRNNMWKHKNTIFCKNNRDHIANLENIIYRISPLQ